MPELEPSSTLHNRGYCLYVVVLNYGIFQDNNLLKPIACIVNSCINFCELLMKVRFLNNINDEIFILCFASSQVIPHIYTVIVNFDDTA